MRTQVINNCNGPHYLQCQKAAKDKPAKLVILRPGLNLVDTETLQALRTNPAVEVLFKEQIKPSLAPEANPRNFGKPMLEVKPGELPDAMPLAKLKLDEATQIVNATEDTDLLAEWQRECKPDNPLLKVIGARMKSVTSGIQPEG